MSRVPISLQLSTPRLSILQGSLKQCVINAGRFSLQAQIDIRQKRLTTEVCWADLKSMDMIINPLRGTDPALPIVAEEGGMHRKPALDCSGPVAVIDPIDGTLNYAEGGKHFGIAGSICWYDLHSDMLHPIYSIFYAPAVVDNVGMVFEADSVSNRAWINGRSFVSKQALLPQNITTLYYRAKRVMPDDPAQNFFESKMMASARFQGVPFQRGISALLSSIRTVIDPSFPCLSIRSSSKIWDMIASHHFLELCGGAARQHSNKSVFPIKWADLVERNDDDKGLFMPFPTICGNARAVEAFFS